MDTDFSSSFSVYPAEELFLYTPWIPADHDLDRYTDFQVNEIMPDGTVAHLTDDRAPVVKAAPKVSFDLDELAFLGLHFPLSS